MIELTTAEIADLYKVAGQSVRLINAGKPARMTDNEWKEDVWRHWNHLQITKGYKKEDRITSIWTTEDFTAIDAAITAGKTIQP